MFCPNCKKDNLDTNQFCGECGNRLKIISLNNIQKRDAIMICKKCKGSQFRKRGVEHQANGVKRQRLQCMSCGRFVIGEIIEH